MLHQGWQGEFGVAASGVGEVGFMEGGVLEGIKALTQHGGRRTEGLRIRVSSCVGVQLVCFAEHPDIGR